MQYKIGEERDSGNITPLAEADLPSVAKEAARNFAEYYGRPMVVTDSGNKDALVARFVVDGPKPARLHEVVERTGQPGVAATPLGGAQ